MAHHHHHISTPKLLCSAHLPTCLVSSYISRGDSTILYMLSCYLLDSTILYMLSCYLLELTASNSLQSLEPRVLRTPWEFDLPIDYTCAYGRFQLYPRGVTILNGHYFSSSETEVIVTFKTVIILVYLVIVIKS